MVPSRTSAGFSVPGYFGRMGIHALTLGTAFPTLLVPRVTLQKATQPLSLAPAPPGRPCGQESRGHWPEARGMGRPDTWIPDVLSPPRRNNFSPKQSPSLWPSLRRSTFRKTRDSAAGSSLFRQSPNGAAWGGGADGAGSMSLLAGTALPGTRFSSPVLIIKINRTL